MVSVGVAGRARLFCAGQYLEEPKVSEVNLTCQDSSSISESGPICFPRSLGLTPDGGFVSRYQFDVLDTLDSEVSGCFTLQAKCVDDRSVEPKADRTDQS